MNKAQHFTMGAALLNTVSAALSVSAGNYGLAVFNGGVVLALLTLVLVRKN